jgi:probable HAF family extracellular repeat protein
MKSRRLIFATTIALLAALALPVPLTAQHSRFRVVEMGTLGGPSSYPSVDRPGYQIISNSGIVAIGADLSTPDPNAPNCFNPDCFLSHTARWKNGVLTDLGAFPGTGNGSAPGAINARGWIVGQSENSMIDSITGVPQTAAALWTDRQIIDLGNLGGSFTLPLAINDAGQVVGFATNTTPDPFSIFYLAAFGIGGTQTRAFLWQKGRLQDLGTLGGPDAEALYINESGQVGGVSYTDATPNGTTGIPTLHPFLWDHGKMIDLGTLGGTISGVVAGGQSFLVNDRGQVTGTSTLAGDQTFHPFLWEHGTMTDLGTLGGDNGDSIWLTDTGDVVGAADLPGSQNHHAFLWRKGVMTDLGTLGSTSVGEMMNSRDQVVGRSRPGNPSSSLQLAFLWENGGPMVDLNTLVPPSPTLLVDATNINERGEIVALSQPPGCDDPNFCGQLVLLVPCGANDASDCGNAEQSATAAIQRHSSTNATTPSAHYSTARDGLARWHARSANRILGFGTSRDY